MEYIKTKNLTKKFKRVKAVDDVSISIESGKIYGLLGPNGSGKSTFMKLVAGLFHPNKGSINSLRRTAKSFLPQSGYSLYADRTVLL